MMGFEQQRKAEDVNLVSALGIRTRADVQRVAAKHGYAGNDLASLSYRDRLFGAAARAFGSDVCAACEVVAISNEMNYFGGGNPVRRAPSICDECMKQVSEAVDALPQWVRDRDLPEVLPALVRAFIQTAREARESVSV